MLFLNFCCYEATFYMIVAYYNVYHCGKLWKKNHQYMYFCRYYYFTPAIRCWTFLKIALKSAWKVFEKCVRSENLSEENATMSHLPVVLVEAAVAAFGMYRGRYLITWVIDCLDLCLVRHVVSVSCVSPWSPSTAPSLCPTSRWCHLQWCAPLLRHWGPHSCFVGNLHSLNWHQTTAWGSGTSPKVCCV